MRVRVERFVRSWLVPLLGGSGGGAEGSVVVVSHGLLLNSLLRVLLTRYAQAEMARLVAANTRAWQTGSEYLASWGNTGYLEMSVRKSQPSEVSGQTASGSGSAPTPVSTGSGQKPKVGLTVVRVNVQDHLADLKKTRGGIGSARFDSRQRTMDSFFTPAAKRKKTE